MEIFIRAAAAIELLRSVPKKSARNKAGLLAPSPHVFTAGGEHPICGYSAAKKRLDAAMVKARKEGELKGMPAWTVHDLHRTVATEMGRLGAARFTISRVLNHADRSVTGIYDRHSYLEEKRQTLETWAKYLVRLTQPVESNVVAWRRGATISGPLPSARRMADAIIQRYRSNSTPYRDRLSAICRRAVLLPLPNSPRLMIRAVRCPEGNCQSRPNRFLSRKQNVFSSGWSSLSAISMPATCGASFQVSEPQRA